MIQHKMLKTVSLNMEMDFSLIKLGYLMIKYDLKKITDTYFYQLIIIKYIYNKMVAFFSFLIMKEIIIYFF